MTTTLALTSEPTPASQSTLQPPSNPNEHHSAEPRHILVQLALKIELPTADIENFKSSGAIVISVAPA